MATGVFEPFMPPVDDQLTIDPPPVGTIARMPCFVPSITPKRLTDMIRSYSSTVASAGAPPLPMPATLSTASTRPNASSAAANIASTSASLVTSTWNGTTASPSAAAVSSSRPLMSAASTRAPSRTNTLEHARAMPEPAPVITATLPSSSPMVLLRSDLLQCEQRDDRRRGQRQVGGAHPEGRERVGHRVHHRGRRADGAALPHTLVATGARARRL